MSLYEEYKEKMRKIADVHYSMAVLGWDREIYLPKKGAKMRSQQVATLAGIAHEMATAADLGKLLEKLSADDTLDEWQKCNVAKTLKSYKRQQLYTKEFVIENSNAISAAYEAWIQARKNNDFSLYEPALSRVVALKRQECEFLGYEDHPYDALLDQYEPDAKTADLNVLFADVRRQLVEYVKQIGDKKNVADNWMFKHFDKDKQWQFGLDMLKQMGYDFDGGRQDVSAHPFTTSFGAEDVRVTTRIDENNFSEMFWSCIHEGGHALYEQGLKTENYGLPTGEAISMGIHESQSRLWENNVGRSLPYWKANYPALQAMFPDNLKDVSVVDFYKSMNKVGNTLIRTNADELTYHFHILVRFEIEKALIEGNIEVKDLPQIWNQRYKEYLGVDVTSDAQGVLQDIHWSHGSFGYFPTYSLGSFYAAQFYMQAKKDIDGLEQEIEKGNMKPLLNWLRENVHQYGKLYSAEDLCKKITGEPLKFQYFMDYAKEKYNFIYDL